MAVMLSKTYAAFVAAGAPQKEAEEAASELASYETRFGVLERDMSVLKWMVGGVYIVIAGSYAAIGTLIWLTLKIAAKVGVS